MVLLRGAVEGDRAQAALRLESTKIQKALRVEFPNLNRLISRERFADLASMAAEEGAALDPSMNLRRLREAAYAMFDQKLDTTGTGMASVRQAISLLRFGYMTAAGAPITVGQELFAGSRKDTERPLIFSGKPYS